MKRPLRAAQTEEPELMHPSGSPDAADAVQPSVKRRKTQSAEPVTSIPTKASTRVSARQPQRKPRAPADRVLVPDSPVSTIKSKESAGKIKSIVSETREISGEGKGGGLDAKKGSKVQVVITKGKGKPVVKQLVDDDFDRDASGDDDSGDSSDDWTPENNKEGAAVDSEEYDDKVEVEKEPKSQEKKAVVPSKSE